MEEGGCPVDQLTSPQTMNVKYRCEQCDYCTDHRYRLQIHTHNQHTVLAKTKALVCKFCSYRTHYTTNLNNHLRTHTGEKPFSCHFCGRSFATRSNLKNHVNIHTGYRRRVCPYPLCQYKSNRVDAIKAHMARYHPEGEVNALPVDLRPMKFWTGVPGESETGLNSVAGDVSAASVFPYCRSTVEMSTSPAVQPLNALFNGGIANGRSVESSDNSSECIDVKPSPEDLLSFDLIQSSEEEEPDSAPPYDETSECDTRASPPDVSEHIKEHDSDINGVDLTENKRFRAHRDTSGVSSTVTTETQNVDQNVHRPTMEHFAKLLGEIVRDDIDTGLILNMLVERGKLHRCQHCNVIFPEYSTYLLHRGCHGNGGAFQCHFCQRVFSDKFGFMTHFMQCLK